MGSRYDRSEAVEDITCTCSRAPLLARLGSEGGVPFLHIQSVRSRRTIVDCRIIGGTVVIKCRECLRTHTIKMDSVMRMNRRLGSE